MCSSASKLRKAATVQKIAPLSAAYALQLCKAGLYIFTKAYFRCPSGMGTASCGLGVKSDGRLTISGTEGYVVAEAPWWKTTYFEVHRGNDGAVEKYSERFLGDGLRYEISDFLALIHGSDRIDCKLTRGDSITMAGVMEQFLERRRRAEAGERV